MYRPGALTKSQIQSQHMVGPLEGPKEGKEGQQVDRLGHRPRKASPRKGVASRRRRQVKRQSRLRYRRCYPLIPMGREEHGGGNTVRKPWAPMA